MNQGGFDTNDQLGSSGEQHHVVRSDDGIVPATIKQLISLEIDEDSHEVKLDGVSRKQFSIVGVIKEKKDLGLEEEYIINDTTGDFKVKFFVESGDAVTFNEDQWVYVCGRVATSEKNSITAYTIREVTDFNQVAYHMLSACFVHLQTTCGAAPGSSFSTHVAQNVSSNTTAAAQHTETLSKEELGEKIKDAVVNFLKNNSDENGLSDKEIIEALSTQYSADDIKNAIQNASFNGEIYATNDEDHYAIC